MQDDNINKHYGTKAAYKRIPMNPNIFWRDVKTELPTLKAQTTNHKAMLHMQYMP